MRTAIIEVFSDFTCPWCYITKRRLDVALRHRQKRKPGCVARASWGSMPSPSC
jgi:predicted DsbA family dithiol-disulfide isomerase